MKRDGTASDKRNAAKAAAPPPLPQMATSVDEPVAGEPQSTPSSQISTLMTEVLRKKNLKVALERVKRNKGAPGIDGMTIDDFPSHGPSMRFLFVVSHICTRASSRQFFAEPPLPSASG